MAKASRMITTWSLLAALIGLTGVDDAAGPRPSWRAEAATQRVGLVAAGGDAGRGAARRKSVSTSDAAIATSASHSVAA